MSSHEQHAVWLKIPPPIWAIVSVLIAFGIDRIFDWTAIAIVQSKPVAYLLVLTGLGLAVWGLMTFRAVGTEIMPTSPTNAKLVIAGPFRYTRNPMYSGLVAVCTGIALYAGTLPFFLTTAGLA